VTRFAVEEVSKAIEEVLKANHLIGAAEKAAVVD
jgi:hypothetical protein